MTLSALISGLDDAALIAVSSKGVLIRAAKDVTAGLVSPLSETRFKIGDHMVEIAPAGINDAQCTCPATGTCRHIVAAVLFLRTHIGSVDASPVDDPPRTVGAPSHDDILVFAGQDWARAVAMANEGGTIEGQQSQTVTLTATGETVNFRPNEALRDAVAKPSAPSRKRVVIAAAALVLSTNQGTALPEIQDANAQTPGADPKLLDTVERAIEDAATALATGAMAEARDRLFAVAVSARADAVPRLASELRAIARRMTPDALREPGESPAHILAALARSYALCAALRTSPGDIALVGQLARSYATCGPRDLAVVGTETWRTSAGARGVSVYLLDPETGDRFAAADARGAGMDLGFDAASRARTPIWLAGSPVDLVGQMVHFDDLSMASDHSIALSQRARKTGVFDIGAPNAARFDHVSKLLRFAQAETGHGLRQNPRDIFALFAPQRTQAPHFDGFRQDVIWNWEDAAGDTLSVTVPEDAAGLLASPVTPTLGLLAIGPRGQARLVTLWVKGIKTPFPLEFRQPVKRKDWRNWLGRVALKKAESTQELETRDPLERFFERALEAVLSTIAARSDALPAHILTEAAELGQNAMTSVAARPLSAKSPRGQLVLAYRLALGLGAIAES